MTPDPGEELALWRYHLIAEALSPRLGSRERGLIVRRLGGEEHTGVDGQPRWVSRSTIDRWIVRYRSHGLAGLRDRPRSDLGSTKRHPELIEEAVRLRLEQPARSGSHIAEMLSVRHGVRLSKRTVREQLQKRGLTRAELRADQRTWGRYEASEPNQRWIADVLAKVLGVGRTKLYTMIRQGELPVLRVGRLVRIPRSALNAWIVDRIRNAKAA